MQTLQGESIVYMEQSNDGNLEAGWAVIAEGEEFPTLCIYYEPRKSSGKHSVEYRYGLGQDSSDTLNDIYQTWPTVGIDGELDCEGEYVGDRRHAMSE